MCIREGSRRIGRIGLCQQGTVQDSVRASEQKNANGLQPELVPIGRCDLSGAVEIDLAKPRTSVLFGVRANIDLRQTDRMKHHLSTIDDPTVPSR